MSNSFDLADLVALPGMPHISVEISPGIHVPVDESVFQRRKSEFIDYCKSIPQESLTTRRSIVDLMNGNETLAGLLVALADREGVWTRHPPIQIPGLWVPELHPMVLFRPTTPTTSRRVPKPSAGDLEQGLVRCSECGAMVGKHDSLTHEHKESAPGEKCNLCEYDELAEVAPKTRNPVAKEEMPPDYTPEPSHPSGPESDSISGLSAYLKAMNEP